MGRRGAPYKCFAGGKTLAQGGLSPPEHEQGSVGPRRALGPVGAQAAKERYEHLLKLVELYK